MGEAPLCREWWRHPRARDPLEEGLRRIRSLRRGAPEEPSESARALHAAVEELLEGCRRVTGESRLAPSLLATLGPTLPRLVGELRRIPASLALPELSSTCSGSRSLLRALAERPPGTGRPLTPDAEALARLLHEGKDALPSLDETAGRVLGALLTRICEALLGEPDTRLAVYGTLAPGQVNHDVLAGLDGVWSAGFVRGELGRLGWGAEIGFPALRWRPDGPAVPVQVLTCGELPHHWGRLDRFEGPDYCRVLVPVERDRELWTVANLYEAA